jgi:Fe-S cluster assembly ATP-binding protein
MLTIKNLHVNIAGKDILKGVNLQIGDKQVCVLMGKNGSGKSTLAHSIMGNPFYKVTADELSFDGKNLIELSCDHRSKLGLFLAFQNPPEIFGVKVESYLRTIYNTSHAEQLSPIKFRTFIKNELKKLGIRNSFLERNLNEGFSGGEKKKLEILQALVLHPKLLILDEPDSGLDVDALKTVAHALVTLQKETNMSMLLITHSNRFLKYLVPDVVHIIADGKLIKSGGRELADDLDQKGYNHL